MHLRHTGKSVRLDKNVHPYYANAHYPRIKRLQDGRYMLTFQRHRHGDSIYVAFSDDLEHFTDPQLLIRGEAVSPKQGGTDILSYATADAAVLKNGDILVAASFRLFANYRKIVDMDGVAVVRSCDGGKTWSEPQVVYQGTNWEPSILVLDSGEIQVYLTMMGEMLHARGVIQSSHSTGVGMVRSLDNGHTWQPVVDGAPYHAQRLAQQYVMDVEDKPMYTDQMPVAVQLQDGSIALAMESQLDTNKAPRFDLSFAYSKDNWAKDLELYEEGPEDRITNVYHDCCAPYLVKMTNGKTVLSYNTAACEFYVRLGDEKARTFGEGIRLFEDFKEGFWGALEALPDNHVVAVFPNVTAQNKDNCIGLEVLCLEED